MIQPSIVDPLEEDGPNKRPRLAVATAPRPKLSAGMKGKGASKKKKKSRSAAQKQDSCPTVHTLLADMNIRTERLRHITWVEKQVLLGNREDFEHQMNSDDLSEVDWELCETSFRFELVLLDRSLQPDEWRLGEDVTEDVEVARMTRELLL